MQLLGVWGVELLGIIRLESCAWDYFGSIYNWEKGKRKNGTRLFKRASVSGTQPFGIQYEIPHGIPDIRVFGDRVEGWWKAYFFCGTGVNKTVSLVCEDRTGEQKVIEGLRWKPTGTRR